MKHSSLSHVNRATVTVLLDDGALPISSLEVHACAPCVQISGG